MEKGTSQDKPYLETHRIEEIADEFFKGRALTIQISPDEIPDYALAAAKTGFRVEKIAGEGEEFPHSKEFIVSNIKVEGKGAIAISIEKPKGSKGDHVSFWKNLESKEEYEKRYFPSKSTTESTTRS